MLINFDKFGDQHEMKYLMKLDRVIVVVTRTASTLEESSSILVNKLPISIASILSASNCLRNRVTQFETLVYVMRRGD